MLECFRYRIDAEQLTNWCNRLKTEPIVHGSIVGPEGTGKTVLMEDLFSAANDGEWIKVREEDSLRTKIHAGRRIWSRESQPLFLDGGEVLPSVFFRFKKFRRPKLIVTLHRDRRSIPILFQTHFDPAIALDLFAFVMNRRANPGEAERVAEVCKEHSGNMRSVIGALYRDAGQGRFSPH